MESSIPKLEIIQDFDSLINRVEIDIKESLEKYNGDQVLGELECFQVKNRNFKLNPSFRLDYFDSYKPSQENDQWSESTKVVDYLNQIRLRTVEELKKAQEESLENYILVDINDEEKNTELKSETSANQFYFQIRNRRSDDVSWIFNLYTFITDFYMSQSDIDLLE